MIEAGVQNLDRVLPRHPKRRRGLTHLVMLWALIFLLSALFASRAAFALDPSLKWQTLETDHFSIHFHQGLEGVARRSGAYGEEAWRLLEPLMEATPKERIQVVIGDVTDSANGSASVFSRTLIRLNPTPPDGHSELNDTEDWLWTLMVHELTHVFHLSDVSGLPDVVNRLFGRRWVPNAIQPNWAIEGVAVHSESLLSTGGRNRSSLYDMNLRLMALSDVFPDLDDISGSPAAWPRASVPYLFGARFVDWIVQENGPEVIARLSHDHSDMILPIWKNLSQSKIVGKSWRALFLEWRQVEEAKARKLVSHIQQQGETVPRVITSSGEKTGNPKFCRPLSNEEDRLCFIDAPGTRRPSIRSLPLRQSLDEVGQKTTSSGEIVHAELWNSGAMDVSRDGKTAVVSQTVTHRTDYSLADLYLVDLTTGQKRRLTQGMRASDPVFSLDGASVIFVRRNRGGTQAICRLTLATGRVDDLFTSQLGQMISTPTVSWDDNRIAFSLSGLNGRHIALWDINSSRLTLLTEGQPNALRLDPTFTPDGQSIVYTSDEGGVYDLFRLNLTTLDTVRLTRVISGAFSPTFSSDGEHLAFVVHSERGSDVALAKTFELLPLARGASLDRGRGAPAKFLVEARDESGSSPSEGDDFGIIHPYESWRSLGAYTWFPEFRSDADGASLGITTFGEDAVGIHSWNFAAGIGIQSHQPYLGASYSWRGIRPILSLALSSNYGRGYWASWFPERQWTASISASYPIAWANNSISLGIGFSTTLHQAIGTYVASTAVPVHPTNQLTTSLRLSAVWSNAWTPAVGISPSEGWTVSLGSSISATALGSQRNYGTVTGSISKFLTMPWHDLHVLALRLRGGIGWSDMKNDGLFALGGAEIRNPISDYIDGVVASTTTLKGYAGVASVGDRFLMGSAEFRLPIANLDFGFWTLPLFFRRLHGAITADLGWIGSIDDGRLHTSGPLPSVGAVLRLETLVGYDTLTQLQVGYAFGFAQNGIHNVYIGLGQGF